MSTYRVTATRRIGAPARVAYDIIADYRDGHPRIIPPPWFQNIRVDAGGVGQGTRFRFDIHAFGSKRTWHAVVDEPSPGRVLAESYPDEGTVTTFTVEPIADDRACNVTIMSDVPDRGGLVGAIERAVMSRFLRKVFIAELARLDSVARARVAATRPSDPAAV
jgi:hypothetical protein